MREPESQHLSDPSQSAEHQSVALPGPWPEAARRGAEQGEQSTDALRSELRRFANEMDTKNRGLQRKDRLASFGELATLSILGFQTDLVQVQQSMLDLLAWHQQHDACCQQFARLGRGLLRIEMRLQCLSQTAHPCELQQVSDDLDQIIAALLKQVEPQTRAQQVAVAVDIPQHQKCPHDPQSLLEVLYCLVASALANMPCRGELLITACCCQGQLEIEVADNRDECVPIRSMTRRPSSSLAQQDFEDYHLALARALTEAGGGTLTLRNCAEGGAAVTLQLPTHRMRAAA